MLTDPKDPSSRDLVVRSRLGIGAYVRQLRIELGLRSGEFSDLVGVKPSLLAQVETGFCTLPSRFAPSFAMHLAVGPQEFALRLLGCKDPVLFAMIFPTATIEPFRVTAVELRRAEAVLERDAKGRAAKRAAAER